jgi:hypothetical protein
MMPSRLKRPQLLMREREKEREREREREREEREEKREIPAGNEDLKPVPTAAVLEP